jgi:hypothetical protein
MTAFLCLHNPQETGSCFLGETHHIQIILTDHNTVHVYHLKQKSQYIKQIDIACINISIHRSLKFKCITTQNTEFVFLTEDQLLIILSQLKCKHILA